MSKIAQAAAGVVEAVREHVTRRLAPFEKRLAALEAQQQKTLADSFRGGWMAGSTYTRGELCQHRGELYLCLMNTDSEAQPGHSAAWRCLSGKRTP
jgi:hypothetical protein